MNYERFLEVVKYRRSIRGFKPDPIPDEAVTKILDAGRYAMSGANSQPWDFIVVKDPETRKRLFEAYMAHWERAWHMEQQRLPEYRRPTYNIPAHEKEKAKAGIGWRHAPVLLAILFDPRKQEGTVTAARLILNATLFRTMGHLSMLLQLAAASLGLGSQRVDVLVQGPFREILGYPEPLELDCLVPLGYRSQEPGPPVRLSLEEMLHVDKYDMKKYLKDEDFGKYMVRIMRLGGKA